MRFSFNICATDEASNFKFAMQLGLAKAYHENYTQKKSGRGLGLGKLPYIWGSPLIFLQLGAVPVALAELLVTVVMQSMHYDRHKKLR